MFSKRFWVGAIALVVSLGVGSSGLAVAEAAPSSPGERGPVDPAELPLLRSSPAKRTPPVQPAGDFSNPPADEPPDREDLRRTDGGFDGERSQRLEDLTSATREVFANPDGSFTEVVSQVPARVADGAGGWREIDLDLVTDGRGGYQPAAGPVPVRVMADPTAGLVEHATAAGPIRLGVPDVVANPTAATVEGPVATVRAGAAGVRAAVQPVVSGVKLDVVFDDAATARAEHRIEVSLPAGFTARDAGASGVEFVAGDGTVVSSLGGGVAFDSAERNVARRDEVGVTTRLVGQRPGVATVAVSVDEAWLADPVRVFPVTVDPLYYANTGTSGNFDTYVQSNICCTPQAGATELKVGSYYGGGLVARRALLRFDLGAFPMPGRRVVDEAHLAIFNSAAATCTAKPVSLYSLGASPNSSTVWSNQPGGVEVISEKWFSHGYSGCGGGWEGLDLTALAQDWADGAPNHGLGLLATDEMDTFSSKVFLSGETGTGSAPALFITYRTTPNMAVPGPGGGTQNGATTLGTPDTGSGYVWLAVDPVTDPDGDSVKYWARVTTSPDAESGEIVWNSGWQDNNNFTVPRSALREGTYYWHVMTIDPSGLITYPNWAWSFSFTRRLGVSGPSPMDTAGPVAVNLATGNLVVQAGTPSFPTVGGSMGVSFTYNSQTPPANGLRAEFFTDINQDKQFGGTDPSEYVTYGHAGSANWGEGSPGPDIPANWFMATLGGYITTPTTGTWWIGAKSDDGVKIKVNNVEVLNRWVDQGVGEPMYEASTSFTGAPLSIDVEYYEATGGATLQLFAKNEAGQQFQIPTDWLSHDPGVLPAGWTASADLDGSGLGYARARIGTDSVVVYEPDGAAHEYRRNGIAWTPPTGEDGVLSSVDDGSDVKLTLADAGGFYRFNRNGHLIDVTSTVDDRQPAAPKLTFTGSPPRLTEIADRVDPSRKVTLVYAPSASCPIEWEAPTGMLCAVKYWAGTFPGVTDPTTALIYSDGLLKRIVDPGEDAAAVVTDFAYSAGKLTEIRDPLATDWVAALPPTTEGGAYPRDTSATRTLISYTGDKVTRVQLAEPTPGAARPTVDYVYSGATDVKVTGALGAGGYTRRVTFDSAGRQLTDTDATGKTTSQVWATGTGDRLDYRDDPAGRRSSVLYDHAQRPVTTYGPAPAGWFTGANLNAGQTAPSTTTAYDGGMPRLAGTYRQLGAAVPVLRHSDGVPDDTNGSTYCDTGSTGVVYCDWGNNAPQHLTSADNWHLTLTGELTAPQTGVYKLRAYSDSKVRVFADDQLLVDGWTEPGLRWVEPGVQPSWQAGSVHRFRVEFADTTGPARLELHWVKPDTTSGAISGVFGPRYGLVTTSTDKADNPADDQITTTDYAAPYLGLATKTTVENGAVDLVSTTTYEAPGDGFLRRTARTLPADEGTDNKTANTYAHYGNTETVDNPCTTGVTEAISQAGLLKTATAADPDGTDPTQPLQPIVREQRHDTAGRVVASRIGSEPWTCTTFDSRGRPVEVAYPAFGGASARTVTTNYAVGGDPLVTSVTDPAGTISTTVDLLGRVLSYTDVWGKTTTTSYDQAGRVTQTVGPAGTLAYTHDPAGRVETMSLDGAVVADPAYDSAGELSEVKYLSGVGNAGNGTTLTPIIRDDHGRLTGLTWNLDEATVRDEVARNRLSQITNEKIDGTDVYEDHPNFTYDRAGRLITARVPGHNYEYGYATDGSCGTAPKAGLNTNRTSLVDNGGTPVTYCYDHADRLTATTQTGYTGTISYDAHGNTTAIAGETRSYDAADRHLATTKGTTTVTYTRDATDRIVARHDGTTTVKYAYSATGDTGDATLDGSGAVIERTIGLPGGVLLTKRGGGDVWSYPNIHGDIIATADAAGAKQGNTLHWGPYGETLSAVPDNSAGAFDHGWLGQHQRPLEHQAGLVPTIEMGARQYDPILGRFLETDPIEGGSANDYDYAMGDPINGLDLDGRKTTKWKQTYFRVQFTAAWGEGLETPVGAALSSPTPGINMQFRRVSIAEARYVDGRRQVRFRVGIQYREQHTIGFCPVCYHQTFRWVNLRGGIEFERIYFSRYQYRAPPSPASKPSSRSCPSYGHGPEMGGRC